MRSALEVLLERGVEGIKIVVIAKIMGVTSGSLYWHFNGLRDLLDCVLDYWETGLMDFVISKAKSFCGSPERRIFNLMQQVIERREPFMTMPSRSGREVTRRTGNLCAYNTKTL